MKIYKTAGEDEPGGMNVFARLQRWHCPNCGEKQRDILTKAILPELNANAVI